MAFSCFYDFGYHKINIFDCGSQFAFLFFSTSYHKAYIFNCGSQFAFLFFSISYHNDKMCGLW